jgi:acetyl-CoA carboxylase biotin carboxyl carrier protein
MNIKEIQKIIELMNANGIVEFTLEEEGVKISMKKGGGASAAHHDYVFQQIPSYHSAPPPKDEKQPAAAPAPLKEENVDYICSPIVGTFYKSPSPDAEAYVKAGQKIEVNQVVCIVEAMKVMNEIKSDFSGTIEEVLVENGEPVEFNQKMFKVKRK